MSDRIQILFGIDMETDVGHFTPYYEGVKNGTPLLMELFEKKDIKATFYFTGDAARQNPHIVGMVRDNKHEIGCHSLFHETVGVELSPIPGVRPLLKEEVGFRLKVATQWVEEVNGIRPVSFRAPRLWGSTAVINALEDLGYISDASYPMYFFREKFVPYHPNKDNWTKEGNLNILEIPNFADMYMESKDLPLERDRDQWPLFRTKGAVVLMEHIENFLKFVKQRDLPPVLCFYFHPWEFVKMKRKYHYGEGTVVPDWAIIDGCGKKACKELGILIDMLREAGGEFHTAESLTKLWDLRLL